MTRLIRPILADISEVGIAEASLPNVDGTSEDQDDVLDADAAWDEPGESIPLPDLEAEFGEDRSG